MPTLQNLFDNNRRWAENQQRLDPDYFPNLARQQAPQFFWIGCADSRVPANQILDLAPGELFVHRNVANVVVHSDLNCLSVTQFAVDVLKVTDIILCGHYGCSGVRAALQSQRFGLVDNWLRHVQDVRTKFIDYLKDKPQEEQVDRLCELNVIEQSYNLCRSTVVEDAWDRGQQLRIHGLIYGLEDGLLRNLKVSSKSAEEARINYMAAVEAMEKKLS